MTATVLALLMFFGTPVVVIVFAFRYDARAAKRREILVRAEYEHRALLRGDTRTGMFGRWQPAKAHITKEYGSK